MTSLEDIFKQYAAFGSKGKTDTMTGAQFNKLIKDRGFLKAKPPSKKCLTTTTVDLELSRVCKGAKSFNFSTFKVVLEKCAAAFGDKEEFMERISQGGGPSTAGTTKTSTKGGVEKLTDTSKYTGSHKERFDAEGKGKGLEGRKDMTKNTGYVGAYKMADTYDETHK